MKIQKISLLVGMYLAFTTLVSSCNKSISTESSTTNPKTNNSTNPKSETITPVNPLSPGESPHTKKDVNSRTLVDPKNAVNNSFPSLKELVQQVSTSGKCGVAIENSDIEVQENNKITIIINCGIINNIIIWNPQTDEKGRKFQMVAQILASNHQWKMGSITEVEGTNKGLSILKDDDLSKEAAKILVSKASTQITIGAASTEGNDVAEIERAYGRAVEIRKFITKNYGVTPKYLLNLGRFQGKQCDSTYYHQATSTKYQRPIVIMSLIRETGSPEPDKKYIEKIVKEKLDSLGRGLSYKCYSNFDLVTF